MRHQEVAARAVSLMTGTEVEDVVQEAFVKAYRTLGSLRAGEAFRPWLVAIATNEARNRARSTARGRRATFRLALREPAVHDRLEDDVAAADAARRLVAAVHALRDDDRTVVTYRYLLDLSEAETAQALGIAPGTVKSRLSRALSRLRELLGEVR